MASRTEMQRKDCPLEEVREAGTRLLNRICNDTVFLIHRPASTLLLVQGCFSFCQMDVDLCWLTELH